MSTTSNFDSESSIAFVGPGVILSMPYKTEAKRRNTRLWETIFLDSTANDKHNKNTTKFYAYSGGPAVSYILSDMLKFVQASDIKLGQILQSQMKTSSIKRKTLFKQKID